MKCRRRVYSSVAASQHLSRDSKSNVGWGAGRSDKGKEGRRRLGERKQGVGVGGKEEGKSLGGGEVDRRCRGGGTKGRTKISTVRKWTTRWE